MTGKGTGKTVATPPPWALERGPRAAVRASEEGFEN